MLFVVVNGGVDGGIGVVDRDVIWLRRDKWVDVEHEIHFCICIWTDRILAPSWKVPFRLLAFCC